MCPEGSQRGRVLALALALLAASLLLSACGESAPVSQSGEPRAEPRDAAPAAPSERKSESAQTEAGSTHRPPNLVLITLDTVRADALGAYGQARPTTPEIDRLARQGVLFEQVSTSQPETLPSHSTIFTGKMPYAHGVRANGGFVLSEKHRTLAEALKEAGYTTGAEVAAMVLRKETQVTQGFDHYRGAESPGVEHKVVRFTQGPEREQTKPMRTAADISKRGIEFIRKNRGRPFFLWLHYFDAHVPHSAPALFNQRVPGSPYHAEVASADFQVGRVVKELTRLGLEGDTLVVVTSDHGEGLGDHGEASHSFLVYDSTMRVPLIFWGLRGLPAGRRLAASVRTADIAPTALDLLGLSPLRDVQGVSLAPLVFEETDDPALVAYGESTRFNATFMQPTLRFVREGRWKYIHKVNPELYDLETDPGELVNLASRRPDVVKRLRAELEALLRDSGKADDDAQSRIDAETAEQLIALGYVARSPLIEVEDDTESLALPEELGDPMALLGDVERLTEANGFLTRKLYDQALVRLEPVVERNPKSPYLLGLTATALLGLDRADEAVSVLRRAYALDPDSTVTARTLAEALAAAGERAGAVEVLRQLLAGDPCNEPVVIDLTDNLRALKRYEELVDALGSGARECPEMLLNLNNYAWALATLPLDAARNGALAVEVARDAIERSGVRDPGYLDTLAAALAESGDFAGAREVGAEALASLREMGAPAEVLKEVEGHVAAFAASEPLRVP